MSDDTRSPAVEPDRPPWYSRGLRFACQPDCGGCCTNHDDYAYVYLEGDDLGRLAEYLGMSRQAFSERFTEIDDGHSILTMDRPECPFLNGKRCGVYPARPTQCRTFPFWSDNLRTRSSWRKVREFCPGIGQGELHSLRVIQACVAERDHDD